MPGPDKPLDPPARPSEFSARAPAAWANPLEGLAADLAFDAAEESTLALRVPADPTLPHDDARALRMAVYLGMFDLLAEAVIDSAPDEATATAALERALRLEEATEGPLRYDLFERRSKAESQELVGRMRGREIAVTEHWMIPRLEHDIMTYRQRIAALREALEAAERGSS